ncbi:MAG: sensor histidine kinase [Ardenticatenaceae bacterium]|nr:sensor histidine kinase [Ardenticatenaceae bacterium]MCB9444962.1 sensor histidine kinase [Ardenticatenaceae bacterium]
MKPQPDTPPRYFRSTFTLMYLGIITAVIYFNLVNRCSNRFLLGNTTALIVILVLLLGVEQFEHGRYGLHPPRNVVLTLTLGRMALIEAVALLDCSGFSVFLYPIIPFAAYFSLGSRWSKYLAGFYFTLFIGKAWLADPLWYANTNTMSNLLILTLLFIFMQVMARAIYRDEANSRELERLLTDLEATNRRLQAYAAQVAELAATEERNRLARDIHDSLGHYLTAVNIQLEKALAFRSRSPEEAEQAIRDAKQAASEALQDVRRSVGALRNEADRFSLKQSLQELIKGMGNGRIHIDLHFEGHETGYTRLSLMALYRAAQEGLTNIQKHAQATQVVVEVKLGRDQASLCLHDDGQGFDTAMIEEWMAAPNQTFGLQGIRERLELVRGEMKLTSNAEEGTRLFVTVPKRIEKN